jgi:hypothetical protein
MEKADYIDSFLTQITDESLLKESASPQGQAYAWMLADATDVCSIHVAQRYTLATIYFSTGGNGWNDNAGWLSNSTECEWAMVTCADGEVSMLALCTYIRLDLSQVLLVFLTSSFYFAHNSRKHVKRHYSSRTYNAVLHDNL